MEAPQITSHPECGSQCNGKASASGHNPGNWNISYHEDKPGQCEKKSLFSELITCSATGILITQSQAIQRPRGERVQCGRKDFPELQTGGPCYLVQMVVDNRQYNGTSCGFSQTIHRLNIYTHNRCWSTSAEEVGSVERISLRTRKFRTCLP